MQYMSCYIVKTGLGYNEEENTFHNQKQFHMIDLPDIGFCFQHLMIEVRIEILSFIIQKDI